MSSIRPSHAKAFKRSAVVFELARSVVQGDVVLRSNLHKPFDGQIAQLSGAAKGNLVLAIKIESQHGGRFGRQLA